MPLLESIKYSSNFITHVAFKIDYAPIPALSNPLPAAFHKKIEKDFPIREDAQTAGHAAAGTPTAWIFLSADKKRKITVSSTSFSLELFSYDHYKHFESLAQSVYSSFAALHGPVAPHGLSLKFINTIALSDGRPLDWQGLINESLLHVCNHFVWDKKEISRCLGQIVFDKEDHVIALNYGMRNDDFPAKITRKEYLIDIECVTSSISESDIFQKLKDYHDEIQSLFEGCIDEGLRVMMYSKKK